MSLRRLFLGLVSAAALQAVPASATDLTAYPPQTQQLVGSLIPVGPNGTPGALGAIWSDTLPTVYAAMQNIAKLGGIPVPKFGLVESATLTFGPTQIIVTALRSPVPGACQYGAQVGQPSYVMFCPMRIAVSNGSSVQVVYQTNSWCFVQKEVDDPTQIAFDNTNVLIFSLATFDTSKNILSFTATDNGGGPSGNELCNNPPVHVNF